MTLNSSISIGSQQIAKNKKLNREGDITCLLDINIQVISLMEIDSSREAFGFARDVTGSTRKCTIVNKSVIIFLKRIMTPSLFSHDIFHV